MPAPPDASAPLEARANAEKLSYLDVLVGRYLRGDVAVYRGTGKAQDNASELANTIVYGPRPDGVIPDGPVIAMLNDKPAQPPGSSALLVMHGLPADKHVIFRQSAANPTLTEVSLLSGVATTASLATSCSGCAPTLATRPANISFRDLTATGIVTVFMGYAGQGGHDVDVTAKVVASADLDLADPCTITFDDLVVLTASTGPNEIDNQLKAFELIGNEMIWHSGGAFTVGGAPPCPLVQTYKVDVFVDLNDLGHYGTRNFVPGTPSMQCQPVPTP